MCKVYIFLDTVHTTYFDIASFDFFFVLTCFIKPEFFPYLMSTIAILDIDTLSILFSYIDINSIKVTGQKSPGDKKKRKRKKLISFTSLSLSKCLMLVCYIAKRVAVLLVLVPLVL